MVNDEVEIVIFEGVKYARKKVVLKCTLDKAEEVEKRLFEFTVLQTLAHPFIHPIIRHFPGEHGHHFTMTEWVEGPTLE